MPSKSEKQARFMAACAHGADYESCPPKKVAKDFNKADKGTGILKKPITESHVGTLKVNMKHMHKWKVDQDNVNAYDHIMKNKGVIQTLDTRPYENHLNDFGIFYTKKVNESVSFKEWYELRLDESIIQTLAKKHNVSPDLISKQLKMGIDVEKEHTSDEAESRKIAIDHLKEKPNYYTALANMERGKCD